MSRSTSNPCGNRRAAVCLLFLAALPHVSIGVKGVPTPIVSPIRLTKDNRKPFETEAAAVMAAFSETQRVIDDTLARIIEADAARVPFCGLFSVLFRCAHCHASDT